MLILVARTIAALHGPVSFEDQGAYFLIQTVVINVVLRTVYVLILLLLERISDYFALILLDSFFRVVFFTI